MTIISALLILQKPKSVSLGEQMLSKTGCKTERHWNFWVHGNRFKSKAGLHTFVLSVSEWIERTEAIFKNLIWKRRLLGKDFLRKHFI